MGRLQHGLLGLVATLQVLVAQAPRVSALLQVKGGVLQGGVLQVGPGNIIIQAHPGAADRDLVGETTRPTSLWHSATAAGGGLEVVVGVSRPQEEDTSPHSAATLQRGGTGGGAGGSEQLASRMVTSGSGGTEEAGGGGYGGGAGSRTSHDEHRNVATPNTPRRRPGRSPGAPPPLRGADGGNSTPALPFPIPPQDGGMAERSAPNQYNNNLGSTTTISPPPPLEHTLRPAQDVAAMPPPEVNVDDVATETVNLAADVDTGRLSSSSEEDKEASMILPEPTLAPSITRHYYTYPPALRPNLAYFGFIVYDTTPGYHGNINHARHLQGRDTTVWIAILSVACFLAGIMIATIVCYAIYRRKGRPAPNQHLEDDLPVSDDLDDLLCSSDNIITDDPDPRGVSSSSSSRPAHSGSTEQLLPVVADSTDLELLTCSQTKLLHCDFLSDDKHVHDNSRPGGRGQMPSLHRHPTVQDQHLQPLEEGAGDNDLSTQRRSSRGGSTSTCSRSSCSTCSTVLTLDSPGLAEEGGLRRSSNGSVTGDSPGGYSWGQFSRNGSVSTDNGYFTPGACSLVDWTSET